MSTNDTLTIPKAEAEALRVLLNSLSMRGSDFPAGSARDEAVNRFIPLIDSARYLLDDQAHGDPDQYETWKRLGLPYFPARFAPDHGSPTFTLVQELLTALRSLVSMYERGYVVGANPRTGDAFLEGINSARSAISEAEKAAT